ncbi:putative PAS/PAC sensor protein [Nitrobacter hamburgensis X14]|uniref:Putative PAS/PAC sensor protein n=1 Tax=Nitrobacter hamburgensis (strain DSM 10229 / NCIMB 13809 / X14) TaxID=323097 RepID=Q1QS16_NITHX|nr:PAS domain-containing protein [Nitrobacter hamburgensis]ABE60981.1 putative PAS/PAC sensor protein [Nitrobacter hamburgensis X14]
MFFFKKWSIAKENAAKTAAISKSQAVIEFRLDGTVITANENFLNILGYGLADVQGKHHSMFVEADERSSAAYRDFWARLNQGESQSAEYKRIDRDGEEVWVQASYLPVLDARGKPTKVIEIASDITAKKIEALDHAGQVSAIERTQAVVEFNLDGTIITANKNFLNALGYALGEVQGKHDRMFVEPSERAGAAYREFWAKLNQGQAQSAECKRIGKAGNEVWIQATYNPIADENGKPFKVVTFATDVTSQKLKMANLESQITAIGKSQAVVEFGMDGKVITANDNSLKTFGYSLAKEVQGKHHSMFVEAGERASTAYRDFWARLNRGESQSAEYKRIGKDGKEIWVQASYNPVLDSKGKPTKVIQLATDITARKIEALDNAGQLAAIDRAQAVAAFNLDGTIIAANDKYLKAMGYTLGEVRGKHDGMFVEPSERAGAAYRDFWARLNRGESQSAEHKRIGKDGKEVWIQASYTPILDLNGKPIKVVEYATVIESVADGSEEGSLSIQEAPVSVANQAADDITSESVGPSLSMRRLEASRKNASAGPSLFSNLLANLRDGLSNAMVSSARAVTNFL